MEFSKAAIALIAGTCITAGTGIGYLATRGVTPAVTAQSAVPPIAQAEPAAPVVLESIEPLEPAAAEARPASPPRRPAPVAANTRQTPAASRPAPLSKPVAAPAVPEALEPLPAETEIHPAVPPTVAPAAPEFNLAAPLAPAQADLLEVEIAVDSVIGLQLETAVTSETAAVEDEVVARVTRDVKVGSYVAIPEGATARGEVTLVERGGKLRERARLGVRFTSLVLADGTHVPIVTETIYREGDSPGRESATKIGGGAIGGAILGGILGGGKGAAIGGSIGAGAGSAAVLAGGRNPATLSAGAPVTVRLQEPARVVLGQ